MRHVRFALLPALFVVLISTSLCFVYQRETSMKIKDIFFLDREHNRVEHSDSKDVFLNKILSNVESTYKGICYQIFSGQAASMAQGWQDWMIYHNHFSDRKWGDGFYLDIGTNDAKVISNTLFFDKCLGWKGICAEPQEQYHSKIEKERGCKLVPNCVMGTDRTVRKTSDGVDAKFQEIARTKSDHTHECLGIKTLSKKYEFQKIDLVNLDIEGAEAEVLRCWPFNEVNVTMFLVETNKHNLNMVDFFFHQKGYVNADTFTNVAGDGKTYFIDNLYVKRSKFYKTPPEDFECTPEIKEFMGAWCNAYSTTKENIEWFGECEISQSAGR